MILRYAGVPLLLEDPGFEFQAWLEQSLSLNGLSLFGVQDPSHMEVRSRPRGPFLDRSSGESAPHVGLPLLNYSMTRPPEWRINTLWWPTGATRNSIGLFLADDDSIEKIKKAVAERDGKATLEIGTDDDKPPVAFKSMYLLPPHKITAGEKQGLWLICLVDGRYYWPLRSSGDLVVSSNTTWPQLIQKLMGLLGVAGSADTPHADYGSPDPTELTRKYESVAMLLDSVAASIGMRVILLPNGKVKVLGSALSKVNYEENKKESNLLAGGENSLCSSIPEVILVTCPKVDGDGVYYPDGDVYASENDSRYIELGLECNPTTVPGTKKVFHSTAKAYYDSPSDAYPTNSQELDDLTAKIAEDYLLWQVLGYDQKHIGLIENAESGFDDYSLFSIGSQYDLQNSLLLKETVEDSEGRSTCRELIRDYDCSTRIVSHPPSFGFSSQLSSFPVGGGGDESSSSGVSSSSGSGSSGNSSDGSGSGTSGDSGESSSNGGSGSTPGGSSSEGDPSASGGEGSGSGGSDGSLPGGSGSGCINELEGPVSSLPVAPDASDLQYVLGVDSSGCLKRFPVGPCKPDAGSGE